MFESLKKKLSGLVDRITKKVDEKAERELQQEAPTPETAEPAIPAPYLRQTPSSGVKPGSSEAAIPTAPKPVEVPAARPELQKPEVSELPKAYAPPSRPEAPLPSISELPKADAPPRPEVPAPSVSGLPKADTLPSRQYAPLPSVPELPKAYAPPLPVSGLPKADVPLSAQELPAPEVHSPPSRAGPAEIPRLEAPLPSYLPDLPKPEAPRPPSMAGDAGTGPHSPPEPAFIRPVVLPQPQKGLRGQQALPEPQRPLPPEQLGQPGPGTVGDAKRPEKQEHGIFGSLAEKTRTLKERLSLLKKRSEPQTAEKEGALEAQKVPEAWVERGERPSQDAGRSRTAKPESASGALGPSSPSEAPAAGLSAYEVPKSRVPEAEPVQESPKVKVPGAGLSAHESPKRKGPESGLLHEVPKSRVHEDVLPVHEVPKPERAATKPAAVPGTEEAQAEKPKSIKDRLFGAILETEISESDIDEILSGFEVDLLENDVALEVTERIISDMRGNLKGKRVRRTGVEQAIRDAVRFSLEDVLSKGKGMDLLEEIRRSEKPYKIVFVGINGTGKTTTIAKIANLCMQSGLEPVIAASDTFRAASIEQLEAHANKLGVKLVKHKYGADAAAVAYDAIEHARAKGKPVVLVDTAGRMQTNANLMDELRKILRVVDPNLVVFVGDSLTGNDAVEQARTFNEVRVDAVILTKSDADAKGGACLSISYAIGKPVLYLGTGQGYSDLVRFTPEWFMEKVGV